MQTSPDDQPLLTEAHRLHDLLTKRRIQVVLVGPQGSGKTAALNSFLTGQESLPFPSRKGGCSVTRNPLFFFPDPKAVGYGAAMVDIRQKALEGMPDSEKLEVARGCMGAESVEEFGGMVARLFESAQDFHAMWASGPGKIPDDFVYIDVCYGFGICGRG